MVNVEEVKKEAKIIMENFIKELGNVETESGFELKRDISYREENDVINSKANNEESDIEFRAKFIKNAPNKSGNCILTKKGDWV